MRPNPATLRLVLAFAICGATALPICAARNEPNVTFVPAKELLSDITKAPQQEHGIALKSYLSTPGYSATVVRRTRAGSAEVHRNVSDVWYVIDGGGTLVTGGSLVSALETEPGELRGQRVSGVHRGASPGATSSVSPPAFRTGSATSTASSSSIWSSKSKRRHDDCLTPKPPPDMFCSC